MRRLFIVLFFTSLPRREFALSNPARAKNLAAISPNYLLGGALRALLYERTNINSVALLFA